MALNDIIFNLGQGGLGRSLPGQDYISGLLFYTGSLPSGFSSSSRIKQIFSVADAEALGIKADYSDATAATGSYLISAKGNTGDTIALSFLGASGSVNTGVYTVGSSDTTIALQGAAWAAVINAGTQTHGCTASFTTATLTVTFPKNQGIFLNSGTPISIAITGSAFAGTITQPSGGAYSKQAVWHYHISEYFRKQPQGQLFLGFFAVPGTYTFAEINTIQNFANGVIRQFGVYKDSEAFASGNLTTIQGVCDGLAAIHMPVSNVLYGSDISSVTDLSTLADLSLLSCKNVSAVIAQDGGALGAYLYKTTGKSITTLGAALGTVSLSKVSEDIAYGNKFNISDGTECDTVAFANGTLVSTVSNSLLNALDNKRYIFLRKYVGVSGSYFNDSHCAIAESSDYAYIENNRTIDKAVRNVYAALVTELNGSIVLNSDGTISENSATYYETKASTSLDDMVRNTEISAKSVVVNRTQNVLSTGNLTVTIQIVPIGIARQITVNISFTQKIS